MSTTRSTRADNAQKILDHARQLFAAHGFEAVSLAQISKLVGIRKPSLLYHFNSKDTLRQAVLEELLAHWNDVLPKLLMAATTGSEQFDAVLSKTVAFFTEDRDRARLILRELLDRPDQMRPLLETHVQPWVTIVSNYIRRGQDQGRLWFEVDPQAYVTHVTLLVISSLATFDTISGLGTGLGSGPGSGPGEGAQPSRQELLDRHVRELLRIAKTSLFRPRPASASEAKDLAKPVGDDELARRRGPNVEPSSAPEPDQDRDQDRDDPTAAAKLASPGRK